MGALVVSLLASASLASRASAQAAPPAPTTYGSGGATLVVPDYGTPAPTVPVVVGPATTVPVVVGPATAVPQPRLVQIERSSSIKGLWLPGMIVLPVCWVLTWSSAMAAFPESETADFAWIPVIGPWLMLGTDLNGGEGYAILSGVVQGVAALAIVLGLSIRRSWIEQRYVMEGPGGAPVQLSFGAAPTRDGGGAFVRVDL